MNKSRNRLQLDSTVKEFKDSGNKAFKKGDYIEAICFYTEAMITGGIPDEELAVLYSNRSAAYLKAGDISLAEEDAKISSELNSTWPKGYYRLAMAYKAGKKYQLALESLLLCKQCHDDPTNLDDEIKECKQLIDDKNRVTSSNLMCEPNENENGSYSCDFIDLVKAHKIGERPRSPTCSEKSIILTHRTTFNLINRSENDPSFLFMGISLIEKLKPASKLKINLSNFKPIFLKELSKRPVTTGGHIYKEFVLNLTVMEDPIRWASIDNIVCDERNSYERLSIYNYNPSRTELQNNLGFGSKISIVNPCYKIGVGDGKPLIRVDDFHTIITHSRNEKICRFCGIEDYDGPGVQCENCKRCYYCSRKCLKLDSEEFNHGLICMSL